MFLRAALDGSSYASRPKRLERGSGTSKRLGQRTAVDGRTPLTPTVMRQRRTIRSRQSNDLVPRPWPHITQQDATAQVRDSPYIKLWIPAWSPQNHSHTQFCPLTHEPRLRLRPPTTQTVGSSAAVVFPHAPRLGFSSFGTRLQQHAQSAPRGSGTMVSSHLSPPEQRTGFSTHTRHHRAPSVTRST